MKKNYILLKKKKFSLNNKLKMSYYTKNSQRKLSAIQFLSQVYHSFKEKINSHIYYIEFIIYLKKLYVLLLVENLNYLLNNYNINLLFIADYFLVYNY